MRLLVSSLQSVGLFCIMFTQIIVLDKICYLDYCNSAAQFKLAWDLATIQYGHKRWHWVIFKIEIEIATWLP